MMNRTIAAFFALVIGGATPLVAQNDVRAELTARGAPAEFVDRIEAIVRDAEREGLPAEPLQAKALEGWAKRHMVGPDRVVAALERMSELLRHGRDAVRAAGISEPTGGMVAAAGRGIGRGLTEDDVGVLVQSAPTPEAAVEGIESAGSLAAQGLGRTVAVRAVTDHFRRGRDPAEVLELPSAVSGMMGRGMPISEIGRAVMEGRGISLPGNPSQGAGPGGNRPGEVPPARGNPRQGRNGGQGQGGQGQGNSPRP